MIQSLSKKIFKTRFNQFAFTLFSGSFIAQIIPLAISPLLTRLFPSEMLGIFFLYSSIIIILSIGSTLQLESAIVLPKKDEDGFNVLSLSILVTFFISLIILLIVFFFNNQISGALGNYKIRKWLYFVPVSTFLTGIFQALNYWNNRKNKYNITFNGTINKSFTSGAIQLISGVSGFQKAGLISGVIVGQFVSSLYLLMKVFKTNIEMVRQISFKKMKIMLVKYKNIPVFNTLIGISNSLSNQLPVFLLTRFYGLSITSYYGLSNRIITAPMGMVGQSVGQVFFQKASRLFHSKKNFYKFVKATYLRLFKIAIVPYAIMLIVAPFIFKVLFGTEWSVAGKYTQVLIPWLFVMFLNSPLSSIVTILDKQKQMLVYDLSLLSCRFLSLYFGYKFFHNVFYSLTFYSLTGLLFNIFLIFYFIKISKQVGVGK